MIDEALAELDAARRQAFARDGDPSVPDLLEQALLTFILKLNAYATERYGCTLWELLEPFRPVDAS